MGNSKFLKFALEKIVPIEGDLIMEGLGLSVEDRLFITNNVHVIINCAASVSFNDPLHDALNIFISTLTILEA